MEFVPQDASQSTPEQKFTAGSGSGVQRTADGVAFHLRERDNRTIRDVSEGQGGRFGESGGQGGQGAGSVELNNHHAGEGIRCGDIFEVPPGQFDPGTSHEILEFPFHFVDGGLRMVGFELKDKRYPCRREGGPG